MWRSWCFVCAPNQLRHILIEFESTEHGGPALRHHAKTFAIFFVAVCVWYKNASSSLIPNACRALYRANLENTIYLAETEQPPVRESPRARLKAGRLDARMAASFVAASATRVHIIRCDRPPFRTARASIHTGADAQIVWW